jgi:hypothetical protein
VSRDWESTFRSWGQAPSQSERDKCENTERAIRNAITASSTLAAHSITVFAQGSYANRTNVRQDSDVDICVLCRDVFYYDLPTGITKESYGITAASYEYAQFKNDVGAALGDYFGSSGVTRGNKAFDVHANTYRVDADVVPTFEYRRYASASAYDEGTQFLPDNGGEIINWPSQNYDNGVSKNQRTGERFKAIVRIMKRLRNEMNEAAISASAPIPSFLNECLTWNVPDEGFGHDTYKADVRFVIAHLWNNTRTVDSCSEWGEVNELKYLFRNGQPWTREQANAFLQAAWDYIGFQ